MVRPFARQEFPPTSNRGFPLGGSLVPGRIRNWLGLDIGSTAVKVVELSCRHGNYRLESIALEPVPPNSVVAGEISDAQAVGAAIRRACKRAGTKGKRASVGVANSAAVTLTVDMDASSSDAALEADTVEEALRHIPFPIDEMALDFEPLHLSPRDPAKVEVLLAACRLEHVAQRQEAIEYGGLAARVADVQCHASHRAMARVTPDDAPIALADIGASSSSMLLAAGDGSIITREESFDINGLEQEDGQRGAAREGLLRLLARLLRLVVLASPFDRADRLLLAGGGASTPGLAAHAADRLGLRVEVVNPFAGMSISRRADASLLELHAPVLLNACGLALRGFVEARP